MNGIDKLWSFEVEGSKWPNRQDHTLTERVLILVNSKVVQGCQEAGTIKELG